jgi:cell division protein ZapA
VAEIAVTVNGRSFALSCEDGQENRTRRLAQYIDAKVRDFANALGQVGELRLLLLAALVIVDELAEANQALDEERRRARGEAEAAASAAETAATRIAELAARLEAIAARLSAA